MHFIPNPLNVFKSDSFLNLHFTPWCRKFNFLVCSWHAHRYTRVIQTELFNNNWIIQRYLQYNQGWYKKTLLKICKLFVQIKEHFFTQQIILLFTLKAMCLRSLDFYFSIIDDKQNIAGGTVCLLKMNKIYFKLLSSPACLSL